MPTQTPELARPSKVIRPYPFQARTLTSTARIIAMICGTGIGKTWWAPYWLAKEIVRDWQAGILDGEYIVLGPTDAMARDVLVPTFVDAYKGTDLAGNLNKTALKYELPGGGVIYFRSAEKPQRIEGIHARAAVMDEPGQMKGIVWMILRSRLALHRGRCLMTGYPWNMGWYFTEVFERWKDGDPDIEVIQAPSTENPNYPIGEFEKERKRLPDWLFAMRYLGQFRRPAGLVYPAFAKAEFIDPFEIPGDWPSFVGVDPGVFFAALFLAWHDGTWYAYDERYTIEVKPASEHAEAMLLKSKGVPSGWIYDPSRATDAAELAKAGVSPLVQGKNAIMAGIGSVSAVLGEGRLKIMKGRCPHFVDQMERYSFAVDAATGDVRSELPIKKDDHLPDCFRYVIHTIEGAEALPDDEDVGVWELEQETDAPLY
jgi:hypothetical protein